MSDVVHLALIGEAVEKLPIDQIFEPPYLPRKRYDEAELADLGDSIGEGLMHPILVQKTSDGMYELQAGSRRLRAARMRGYTHISARVTESGSPREVVIRAVAENVHRADLDPLEEATAYLWLHREYGMGINEIAASLHKPPRYVRDRFKVLDTAPEVQQLVADGILPFKTGVLLASVPEGERQVEYAHEAVINTLSPDDMRNRIREDCEGIVGVKPGYARQTLTVAKYRLLVVHMRQKMERMFRAVEELATTPEERDALMKAHVDLEVFSQQCRIRISHMARVPHVRPVAVKSGNIATAKNHRETWPIGHLTILEDKNISDSVAATRTGRTVGAVKTMRSALKSKKKR